MISPSVPSATTWGSPTATKHALLIHGLTSSSHTWHRVASSLAAHGMYRTLHVLHHSVQRHSTFSGYFVTAPNLIWHAGRVSTDYHFNSIVNDLRPYLEARNCPDRWSFLGWSGGTASLSTSSPVTPDSNPPCRSSSTALTSGARLRGWHVYRLVYQY